jgi:hypothetical protein
MYIYNKSQKSWLISKLFLKVQKGPVVWTEHTDPQSLWFVVVGLAYQGKDIIVFRFIIEYSSLRDYGP